MCAFAGRTFVLSVIAFFSINHAKVWDVDNWLQESGALAKSAASTSASAVEAIAARLQPGDALVLSRQIPLGHVTLPDVAPDIQLTGGFGGSFTVTGSMKRWDIRFTGYNTSFFADENADLDGTRFFCSFSGESFVDRSASTYEAIGLGIVPVMGNPAVAKSAADPKSHGGPGIQWGVGKYDFENFGDKKVWMPIYYVDAGGAPKPTKTPQVRINKGSEGGRWLFAIEANQNAQAPCLNISNSKRTQLYSGSTEGNSNTGGPIYNMINCEQVVLGMRRFFSNHKSGSSWAGRPVLSLSIEGGKNNIIHNLIDIGNPTSKSMISTDPGLEIWQSFFEDATQLAGENFQFMVAHQAMKDLVDTWSEPMLVDKEVVLQMGSKNLLQESNPKLPAPPAYDRQRWQTGAAKSALAKRAATAGFQEASARFQRSASFGSAFLAAGADPTGKRASDAALATLMAQGGVIEIPEGRFRFEKGVTLFGSRTLAEVGTTLPSSLLGSGPERTVIEVGGQAEFALDLRPGAALGKGGAFSSAAGVTAVSGVTVRGGINGIAVEATAPTVISDFRIEGFAKAGIAVQTAGFIVPKEGQGCTDDTNCSDVHVYENGTINGGEYGIYYTEFADKQGIRNITFNGQNTAGIWARNNNLFHGWVSNCKFQSINGPGIDLSGGVNLVPKGYGYYVQWVTMIEGCSFIECGNADRAAMDYGYTDISMFANNSIVTRNKTIKYGFLGSVATMSNVEIDVKSSKAAVAIRNNRGTEASRTPANILHSVRSNGELLIVSGLPRGDGGPSDDPASEYMFTTRMSMADYDGSSHSGLKWWRDNNYDWAHTVLLYKSQFGNKKYEYTLMNGTGFEKDLITGAVNIANPAGASAVSGPQSGWLRDHLGRRVMRVEAGERAGLESRLGPGIYFLGDRKIVGRGKL